MEPGLAELNACIAAALPQAAAPAVQALAGELLAAWSAPGRAYHNLLHLQECLAWLDAAHGEAESPDAITLALLFHDAIYEAQRHDNEARSADWAGRALPPLGASAALVQSVQRLILATQSHQASGDADTALLLDIDLAILGASPERFADYEAGIRSEYAFVPEPEYQAARARVMRRFAQRERLYISEFFHARLDAVARPNLAVWS